MTSTGKFPKHDARLDGSPRSKDFLPLRPLFWKVLSKLAQEGYVIRPDDAQDVIQEFYSHAWPGLEQRYDETLGTLRSYVIGAFYRFGREHILKLQAWRGRLREVEHLADRASTTSPPDHVAEIHEIRDALIQLPSPEGTLLRERLLGNTERALATRHHLSRYRVREYLVDAIGRMASTFGQLKSRTPLDRQVAIAVWREGRSIRDTAALLRISVPEVRAARARNVEQIFNSMFDRKSFKPGGIAMANAQLELLKRALLTPSDQSLLELVRMNAAAIRAALEDEDVEFSLDEISLLDQHPPWLSEVYAALAGSECEEADDTELTRAIDALHADNEHEIASAFVNALQTLPSRFHDWERWFGRPAADDNRQAALRWQLNVVEAGSEGEELLAWGLSPRTFIEAGHGVELLADRLIQNARSLHERRPQGSPELLRLFAAVHALVESGDPPRLVLSATEDEIDTPLRVPHGTLLAQIRTTPNCAEKIARPLLSWLVQAGQLKPWIFSGYRTQPLGDASVELTQVPEARRRDLALRWAQQAELVEA